jgi:polysaccharide deacetylase 2 family uncharacterized protein YibQ
MAKRPIVNSAARTVGKADASAKASSPLASIVTSGLILSGVGAAVIEVRGNPYAGVPHVQAPLLTPNSPPAPEGWAAALQAANPPTGRTVIRQIAVSQGQADAEHAASVPSGMTTSPMTAPTLTGQSMLVPAPIAGLYTPGPDGPLPIVGLDGRTSATAYARPFVANGKPKIAFIVGRLGLNVSLTREAIETLPGEVTLSFVAYASGLQGWIDLARQHGHEVLIEVPMEPLDYPANDPGPYTLMATAPAKDTVSKLEWALSRATGYFGVTNAFGSRFVNSQGAMEIFLANLRKRGLAFVDDGSAMSSQGGVLRASADKLLNDQALTPDAVANQLQTLEQTAKRQGQALGKGSAYPVTVAETRRWIEGLERRGFQLAPASALATQR